VLSFPYGVPELPDGTRPLGEIVISVAQAARQAGEAGHSLASELRLLVIHGYLHLLGYDHEVDDGRMMRLQARLARALVPAARR
jgi:probable rRNA maturation factor